MKNSMDSLKSDQQLKTEKLQKRIAVLEAEVARLEKELMLSSKNLVECIRCSDLHAKDDTNVVDDEYTCDECFAALQRDYPRGY